MVGCVLKKNLMTKKWKCEQRGKDQDQVGGCQIKVIQASKEKKLVENLSLLSAWNLSESEIASITFINFIIALFPSVT